MNGMGQDASGANAKGAGQKQQKILVVDDDQLLLGTYAAVFRADGFEVHAVSNGEEAFAALSEGDTPDIVFTGIMMPKMGGFELIEKMRADPRFAKIPVVISSHRGISEDKDRAEKLGVSDFIVQGFTTPREVVRRIELMLGVSRKFRIAVSLDRFSASALIEILNRNQTTPCVSAPGEEIVLELEGTPEPDKFRVRIIC
ncbi:MAG: Response regulator receiver modulated diguanylate cyclase [Parcubacteria group bacterium GW2011_GWB1_50_9]|uniref:Response regulator receiver modulated diguanylate cyclase n=2 Tax=Parcubacteria group TaxID=1794811 RepID=A0A0G1WS22_9BACT|nr:MAG: Response regulator receiver modulated diguanylate cyclase [Parcubacteria group bacterium GW2011_GWB1_50_9]KKW21633.1 MAG: Response regulator receiver modulated diguanylate cyclase [Candidatus Adlerbacteria bacterium GW2011_GWC1_50_9]